MPSFWFWIMLARLFPVIIEDRDLDRDTDSDTESDEKNLIE